jgi:hypothetical protein
MKERLLRDQRSFIKFDSFFFSFETPPSTPNDGQWEPSATIEAFRMDGSGNRDSTEIRLRLGHDPGPPTSFFCRSCPDFKACPKLNNLAKHIESRHCPNELFCLLCKSDLKGLLEINFFFFAVYNIKQRFISTVRLLIWNSFTYEK